MADAKAIVTPVVVEGLEINAPNVTFQRLQEFSLNLFEKLLKKRAERNFLIMERDKLLTILTNVRHKVRETQTVTLNREAELERSQERFRQETKEISQEVKYLEYDNKITLEQLKKWEIGLVAKADEDNTKEMLELLEEKRRLKEELADNEVKFDEQLLNLKKHHVQEILEEEKRNEERYIQKEMEFRRGLIEMKEEMSLRHEMEISELEERKNCHLLELRKIHKKRLDELKFFFNSVTVENLAVISCLRESLHGISKTKLTMAHETETLKKSNKKLQKPLEKSKAEVKNLKRQIRNYEKDLLSLKNNQRLLNETTNKLDQIKKESENALQWLKRDQAIDAPLDPSCMKSIVQYRNYAAARRKYLEEITEIMLVELENKRKLLKQLSEDPEARQIVKELCYEYWSPARLKLELNAAKVAYDQAFIALEEKLVEFCVTETSVGQGLWKVHPTHSGPSGLVAKQL